MQSSSKILTTNKPTPNFYRPDALPVAQPIVSKHLQGRFVKKSCMSNPKFWETLRGPSLTWIQRWKNRLMKHELKAAAAAAVSYCELYNCELYVCIGGTGVSGLMRGLATLPQGGSRSLRWSEIRMEVPQEDPLAVHYFCVCSGSVLLGDLLGVSRSRERDLLSVLSIYPRSFFCIFIVYRHVVRILCLLLYSAIC